MAWQIHFNFNEEQINYLEAAARLRGVMPSVIVRRVMNAVLTDQMILAILDDGDKPRMSPYDNLRRRRRPRVPTNELEEA
jgi:hypothetical protein